MEKTFNSYSTLSEGIQTMEVKANVELANNGTTSKYTLHYYRSQDQEKINYLNEKEQVFFTSIRDKGVYSVYPVNPSGKQKLGTIQQYLGYDLCDSDIWSDLGFRQHNRLNENYKKNKDKHPFAKFDAREMDKLSNVAGKGVSIKEIRGPMTHWLEFSDRYNQYCTYSRYEIVFNDKDIRSSSINRTKFKDFGNGLYLPMEVDFQSKIDLTGQITSSKKYKITKLLVNESLPKDCFVFQFPGNVTVDDFIKKIRYKTDEKGNASGPVQDLPKVPAPKQ
ncbi:hypothetical protein KIH39_13670 [Telmatocola sphagniphila]|uniref:Uncharacterized protein n=1 Tax=Telmatocola sphagniphila TaxID=1123043 RepID=A0A8E6EVX0_9BACT|nr:hypothetical protein [Telmatocola sphagniphila]QVL29918.1 hypothetical protein KIH39_13670 [Telmatocola sphagniphila]